MTRRSQGQHATVPDAVGIRARHIWTANTLAAHPLLLTPDKGFLAVCSVEGDVIFLDRQHWTEITRGMHRAVVLAMCWATLCNQPVLACLCGDGDIRLWPLNARFVLQQTSRAVIVHTRFSAIVEGMIAYEEDRQTLAVAGGGRLTVWWLGSLRRLRADSPITHLRFVEAGTRLLVFYRTGAMVEFDVVEHKILSEVKPSENMECRDTAVTSNASGIIICLGDQELRTYDISVMRKAKKRGRSQQQVLARFALPFPGCEESGQAVGFYRGDVAVTSTVSGLIQLWDIARGIPCGGFRAHGSRVKSILDLSFDDLKYMALGTSAGVEIWEGKRILMVKIKCSEQR
ncbi:WD40 repeat-like protein [Trametes cingulata]|nr:WD40 repeat-like protein [Trametes cingulata]